MTYREIITIQLGHYSNFVGTHWWNLQEGNFSYDPSSSSEINHNVLYREGLSPRSELTYTPRLLLVDLKGSLGYLNERGSLYDHPDDAEPSCLWINTHCEVTKENPVTKPPFIQNLDNVGEQSSSPQFNFETDVNSWVDYLVPRFHPRTVNIVKQYDHQNPNQSFDTFHCGRNLWDTSQFSDEFSDKIRQYAEECDHMQGFQILMDSTDGFAGLGASCIEHLHDEYGKSILVFPMIEPVSEEASSKNQIKALNTAFCWKSLGEHASLFSPMCCGENGWQKVETPRLFDHLTYDLDLKYHTSALIATALDTLSVRYRHKEYSMSALSDLCADLNKFGRKAAATSINAPFPMIVKSDLIDVLDNLEGPLWTSLTPSCQINGDRSMQSFALRGVSLNRLKRPLAEAKGQMGKPAYRCSTVHEMMTMYLSYSCHASANYLTTIEAPLKITKPFPKIFNSNVHNNGDIAAWPVGEDVSSIPVLAGLHSGSYLGGMFDSLHSEVSKIRDIKKIHTFINSGLEQDDVKDCVDSLMDSKEAYDDTYI